MSDRMDIQHLADEQSFGFAKDLKKYIEEKGPFQMSQKSLLQQPQIQKQTNQFQTYAISTPYIEKFDRWIHDSKYAQIQSSQYLILAFLFKRHNEVSAIISLLQIIKANGKYNMKDVYETKKPIECLQLLTCQNQKFQCVMKLALGTTDGELVLIQFGDKQVEEKIIKLEFRRKIVDIKYYSFEQKHILFAMSVQSRIYAINAKTERLFSMMAPNVPRVFEALKLSFSLQGLFILNSTKKGVLTIWQLNQQFLSAYQLSQLEIFKDKNIYFSVSPRCVVNRVTNDQIKYASFWGDLLFILTEKGQIKLLQIELQQQDSFIQLLSYKIKNGYKINAVRIIPQHQFIMFSRKGQKFIQKLQIEAPQGKLDYQSKMIKHTKYELLLVKKNKFEDTPMSIDSFTLCESCKILIAQNRGKICLTFKIQGFQKYEKKNSTIEDQDYNEY